MLPPTASSLLSRLCKYFSFSQPVSRIICFIILKCFPFVNGIFLLPNIFSNLLSFSHNCGRFFVMFTTPNFIYPLHGSTAYAGRQSQPAMHSNRRMAGQNCLCSLHFRRKHQTWDRYIRTHRNPAPGPTHGSCPLRFFDLQAKVSGHSRHKQQSLFLVSMAPLFDSSQSAISFRRARLMVPSCISSIHFRLFPQPSATHRMASSAT